jgi:hypothetical protein
VSGKIRFTVVNIPFKCFTKIDFITEPETTSNPQVLTSSAISSDGCGSDQYALSITNSEILNEKIYCELIESKIRQVDLKKDIETLMQAGGRCTNERTFKSFLESIVIELKLRVMQNQSVFLSPAGISVSGGGNDSNKGSNDSGKGSNDSGKSGNDNGKGGNDNGKGGNDDGKGRNDSGKDRNDDGKDRNDGGKDMEKNSKENEKDTGRGKSEENDKQKDDDNRADKNNPENNKDNKADEKPDHEKDEKK